MSPINLTAALIKFLTSGDERKSSFTEGRCPGCEKKNNMCLDIDVTFLRSLDQRGLKKHFSEGGERLLTTCRWKQKLLSEPSVCVKSLTAYSQQFKQKIRAV